MKFETQKESQKVKKGENIKKKGKNQLWESEHRLQGHNQKQSWRIKLGNGEEEKKGEMLQKMGNS